MGMMDVLSSDSDLTCERWDETATNYGGLDGISEAKELLADMIEFRLTITSLSMETPA